MHLITLMGSPARYQCSLCCKGVIHSIFTKTVNIMLSSGQIITLCRKGVGISPAAVITDLPSSFSWEESSLQSGDNVTIGHDSLSISGKMQFLGISTAPTWDPVINRSLPIPDNPSSIRRKINFLLGILSDTECMEGLHPLITKFSDIISGVQNSWEDPVLQTAYTAIQNLYSCISKLDYNGIAYWSGTLTGLGPGLTPSGDDFLAGIMSVLFITFKSYGFTSINPLNISSSITMHMHKTNSISRHFLKYASKGQTGEVSEQFILSLLCGTEPELLDKAENLLKQGATSGFDQLFGILVGTNLALDLIINNL